jgi:ABC-type glycerol-3-phosphate transport system substrate-binding protein
MKRIIKCLSSVILVASILMGCSSTNTTQSEGINTSSSSQTDSQNRWTYYKNVNWNEDYNGLKMEITLVGVSDQFPKLPSDKTDRKDSSVIAIHFKFQNTTNHKFSFPTAPILITSTGEQVDTPNYDFGGNGEESFGGEYIDGGVTKEYNVYWLLQRSKAQDAKWVKVLWRVNSETEFLKEIDARVELK